MRGSSTGLRAGVSPESVGKQDFAFLGAELLENQASATKWTPWAKAQPPRRLCLSALRYGGHWQILPCATAKPAGS